MTSIRLMPLAVAAALAAFQAVAIAPAVAEMAVEVGGAPMYPSRTIIENAANSKDHTTLIAAMTAADLVETLQGPGPFTVFAPSNRAFTKLPKGTLETLLNPESKANLTAVLTYHVLPGKYSAADLVAAIKKGGGRAQLKTVEGEDLTIEQNGRKLFVIDAKGDKGIVTIPDVHQKNGIIHVVDKVLMPQG